MVFLKNDNLLISADSKLFLTILEQLWKKNISPITLSRPNSPKGEFRLNHLPLGLQASLEPQPLGRFANGWCRFFCKTTPPRQPKDFVHSLKILCPVCLFYLQNCGVGMHQKWQSDMPRESGHISGTGGRIDTRFSRADAELNFDRILAPFPDS